MRPFVADLDVLDRSWPPDREAPTTIVVIPEYVGRRWWDRVLYNQTSRRLREALVGREHTVIADVPFRRAIRPSAEVTDAEEGSSKQVPDSA